MSENNWCVYVHTNKINGKRYVGITSRNPKRRWGKDGNGYARGYFKNAINKYGWDNFKHDIIVTNVTEQEAKKLEKLYIVMWQTTNSMFGYNLTYGGDGHSGFVMSKEHKRKLIESRLGLIPWNKGCKGMLNPFYGKKHSKETRMKMRKNNKVAKKVSCDGIIFSSVIECAEFYGVQRSTMWLWVTGKSGAPKEFVEKQLRYIDDEVHIRTDKRKLGVSSRPVICDGKIFRSAKECTEHYGLYQHAVAKWLRGAKKMPQKFQDLGLSYYDEYSEK